MEKKDERAEEGKSRKDIQDIDNISVMGDDDDNDGW